MSSLPATTLGNASASTANSPVPSGNNPALFVLPPDLMAPPQDTYSPSASGQAKNLPTTGFSETVGKPPAIVDQGTSPFQLPPSVIASMPPNLGYYTPVNLPPNPAGKNNDQQQQQQQDYDSYLHEGARHLQNIDATQLLGNIHRF